MKKFIIYFFFITLAQAKNAQLDQLRPLENFVFGSCNDQTKEQVFWPIISSLSPQFFLWGGDNIYADAHRAEDLAKAYRTQNETPEYRDLLITTPIIGTWDDHDYGTNDADYSNPIKSLSKELFLDFMGEPKDSERRRRNSGIYTSYSFGSEEQSAKIILLDTRFNLHFPEKDNDILGAQQWRWLEDELKSSDAKVHFIVSAISVMSDNVPKAWEWADYPKAHKRLIKLLKEIRPSGVVFLSGDKHFSSIYKNYGHLEFINSGMTHTAPWYLRWAASLFYPNIFFGRTIGHVGIDWKGARALLKLKVLNEQGRAMIIKDYELTNAGDWKELN